MKKILLILAIVDLFFLGCGNITDTEVKDENGVGIINFIVSNPHYFEGTDKICYSLTKENSIAIEDTIVVGKASGVLQIVISNLKVGNWELKVSALDDEKSIYTEKLSVIVERNIKKKMNLKWGNNAGKAASFDGNFSFLEIENSESINSIKNQFTFEAWINPKTKEYNTLLSKGATNFLIQLVQYMHPAILAKGVEFDYSNAHNYWGRLVLNNILDENKWQHIAITYNDILTIYINGLVVYQNYASGTIEMEDQNLRIGRRISDIYPENFWGLIDNVRLWNYSRTQTEIHENMKNNFLKKENGLLCNFIFDKVINDTIIIDKSQYGNNAILKGNLKLLDSYAF